MHSCFVKESNDAQMTLNWRKKDVPLPLVTRFVRLKTVQQSLTGRLRVANESITAKQTISNNQAIE
jgi:hypothetical protein